MSSIADRIQSVRGRISRAAHACGRDPAAVSLLAVSKAFPAAAIRAAHAAGQRLFGESYAQEAMAKLDELADLRADLQWHFIGPLQGNKARPVAEHFDWVHSVDRMRIAQRLSDLRPAHLPPLELCIQVNIDDEPSKSGVAPAAAAELARAVAALPRVRLRGLMCIPAPQQDPRRQEAVFRHLADMMRALNTAHGLALDTLSMGMSDDIEAAVAAGSTMLRVGTAIFGERDYA